MGRQKIIRTADFPYHITSRANNQEWFYIPTEDVWVYCLKHLREGKRRFKVKIESFVLMNNHYHLCLYTPEANVDQFMQFFNQHLGRSISRQAGRINRIFGASYKWSLIKNESYYLNVMRYIYQNPIRAGICEKCEDYRFSDLNRQKFSKEMKDWFNLLPPQFEVESTRKALRKYQIE